MTELPTIPVSLRVHLAHATLQAIAEECGADVLHIKGPAVDPSLRPTGRSSVDADVLVRPAHLKRFLGGLRRFGWTEVIGLPSGGLIEHSTNWYHAELGQVDVHVRFPGIQIAPEPAFDRLWDGRCIQNIANWPCTVPSLDVQRLILLLHAARGERDADVEVAWTNVADAERSQVSALANELRADVAFAAATGGLEDFRDRPEYDLWRLFVDGTTTTAGFGRLFAEVRAVPDGISWPRLRVSWYVTHALVFMPRRLAAISGMPATAREVSTACLMFLRRGSDLVRPRRRD